MKKTASSWLRAVLGVRLQTKVVGANLVLLVLLGGAMAAPYAEALTRWQAFTLILASFAVGAAMNYMLVRLALGPIEDLTRVARRITQGSHSERVPPSLVADPDLSLLASTMNDMLDNLEVGRSRMRKLGADVASAQERERAQLARELNDSVAQTLVAAGFQVAAAANDVGSGPGSDALEQARGLMRTAIEEIRTLCRSLHPRVAEDLGLPAALEALVDATRQRSLIDARLTTDIAGLAIPVEVRTTLYRIAQEALRNVERHADATTVTLLLSARPGLLELEVADNGRVDESDRGMLASPVLARMRERLSLAGGELHIDSRRDDGNRVVATVRLEMEAA
jgi:signal transduction histidine kinase